MSEANLASPLTPEEKVFLWEQQKSEHFRVFQKAINYSYLTQCAMLPGVEADKLLKVQGILAGLMIAKNLLTQATPPEKKSTSGIAR